MERPDFQPLRDLMLKHGLDRALAEQALAVAEPVIDRLTGRDFPLDPCQLTGDQIANILAPCLGGKPLIQLMSCEKDGLPQCDAGETFDQMLHIAEGVVPLRSKLDPVAAEQIKAPKAAQEAADRIRNIRRKIAQGRPVYHPDDEFMDELPRLKRNYLPAAHDPSFHENGQRIMEELTTVIVNARERLGSAFWDAAERWAQKDSDDPSGLTTALFVSVLDFFTMAFSGNRSLVERWTPYMKLLLQAIPLAWRHDYSPRTLLVVVR